MTVYAKGKEDDHSSILMDYHNNLGQKNILGFLSGQLEKCPETGKTHYQAMFETLKDGDASFQKWTLKQCRDKLGWNDKDAQVEGHLEPCKDPAASKKYVKKEESRLSSLDDYGVERAGRLELLFNRITGPPSLAGVVSIGWYKRSDNPCLYCPCRGQCVCNNCL